MTIKLNYIIFALATLTGVAVRTVMLLFTIDPTSGFFRAEYTYSATGFLIFLIAAGIAVFVASLLLPCENRKTVTLDGIPFCAGLVLVAVAMIYETFFSSIMVAVPIVQQLIQYALAAASAGVLCFIAASKFLKREYPPILSLVPILFWVMRLIIVFTEFSTISAISDTVIETLGMCLSLVVFLFFAKLETAQQSKLHRFFYATIMLSGFVCAIGSIPRIVADIFAAEQAVHLNTIPAFTSLATAVFSVIFADKFYRRIRKQ